MIMTNEQINIAIAKAWVELDDKRQPLERELAAVTEQRDRLAEVMTQILNISMNHTQREMLLEQTLQSLTPNEL